MADQNSSVFKLLFKTGAFSTILVIALLLLDIVIGNIVSGGDLSTLPVTAADRFAQFNQNCWLGLYNLDLLNLITQLLLIPAYIALYFLHKHINAPFSFLALLVFLMGTTIFVANNTALPMLDLSRKFASAVDPAQKSLYAAAGEAMLARGAHGSPGGFLSFFIPTLGGLIMSTVMLDGKVFSKTTAWLGIISNILMLIYIAMVNFIPGIEKMAIALAMPGGLLMLAWMMLISMKFQRLGKG